jgi:hypothetical protein
LAHSLECGGKLAKLVPGRVDNRFAEVAAGDPIGRSFEAANAAGEDRSSEIADREGGCQGEQTCNDEPPADGLMLRSESCSEARSRTTGPPSGDRRPPRTGPRPR